MRAHQSNDGIELGEIRLFGSAGQQLLAVGAYNPRGVSEPPGTNLARNLIDGDLDTRWYDHGFGHHDPPESVIVLELPVAQPVTRY